MAETVTPPETAKVTLPGGVVVEVPKADAEKILVAQQKANEERDSLGKKVGAAEAERKAAQELAAREQSDKEAIKLAKDGEIEQARKLFSAEANTKLTALTARLRDQEVSAAIRRAAPHLDDSAVADMKTIIAPRAAYDAESGKVIILGDDSKPLVKDGQPVDAQAYLPEWIAARKHFQNAKLPNGNDGQGGGKPVSTGTLRLGELATASKEVIAGVVARTITLVE